MWIHQHCTNSVAIFTQHNTDPSMVLAGLPHWNIMPGQTSRMCICHSWARMTNASRKWGIVSGGKKYFMLHVGA